MGSPTPEKQGHGSVAAVGSFAIRSAQDRATSASRSTITGAPFQCSINRLSHLNGRRKTFFTPRTSDRATRCSDIGAVNINFDPPINKVKIAVSLSTSDKAPAFWPEKQPILYERGDR